MSGEVIATGYRVMILRGSELRTDQPALTWSNRIGYADMRILNIEGMFRWVSNHRRGIW
jgi:hypothetical protein